MDEDTHPSLTSVQRYLEVCICENRCNCPIIRYVMEWHTLAQSQLELCICENRCNSPVIYYSKEWHTPTQSQLELCICENRCNSPDINFLQMKHAMTREIIVNFCAQMSVTTMKISAAKLAKSLNSQKLVRNEIHRKID